MVLQRGKPNAIWGWSQPGDRVRVEIGDSSATATAGADGRWQTQIQPPPAGGPYTVKISGRQSVELHDVLVGDVWICSGQSNMQFGLAQARNGAEEIKNAKSPRDPLLHHPPARVLLARRRSARHLEGRLASPLRRRPIGGISAVAYFFARRVQESVHVPIGLIQGSGGRRPSRDPGQARVPALGERTLTPAWTRWNSAGQKGGPELRQLHHALVRRVRRRQQERLLGRSEAGRIFVEECPGSGPVRGVGRGRRPQSALGCGRRSRCRRRCHRARPGCCWARSRRWDTTFVNGQQVGASSWVENPRAYFAGRALTPGRNVIAIRLLKMKPDGGFLNPASDLKLTLGDGTVIPLAGEWKGPVAVDGRSPRPLPISSRTCRVCPGVLYRGMLQPIAPLALTGAIWYQGESNTVRAYQYRRLLPGADLWMASAFGQGDFPFYIVSLPRYLHHRDVPGSDDWAELREPKRSRRRRTAYLRCGDDRHRRP